MTARRNGHFRHVQNGGPVSPTGAGLGTSQWLGRVPITKTEHIRERRQRFVWGAKLSVPDPRWSGSGCRCSKQEMDRPPSQMFHFQEVHYKPVPCDCKLRNQTRTETYCRCTIWSHSLLRLTERVVDRPSTSSALSQEEYCRGYYRIFPIAPSIQRRCSTSHCVGELNMEYCQWEPRNQQYSITASS